VKIGTKPPAVLQKLRVLIL